MENHLSQVSLGLREALLPILTEVAGKSPRPSRLTQRLGIDKSLASRLVRASRTNDPFEFMHTIPAPTGLSIFIDRAETAGIDAILITRGKESIDRFQSLIDETPGGRATLDGIISARSREARDRNERSAKQAVYKGMSYLVGLNCDSVISSFIIQPSPDGSAVDCIDIHQRIGLRRLRPSAPVGVFSMRLHPLDNPAAQAPRTETLSGEVVSDVRSYLMPEFCSSPIPDIQIVNQTDRNQTSMVLAGVYPPVDAPVTLTYGTIIRNVLQPYRSDDCQEEWRGYLLHHPCKLLVRDVYIRDDLFVGAVPEIASHIPGPRGLETVRPRKPYTNLNTMDLDNPIEQLGSGMSNSAIREAPGYTDLLGSAFEQSDWDPSRFRGYRARTIYPVPMIFMTWWFPLPSKQ
jgi:hypothetical protein